MATALLGQAAQTLGAGRAQESLFRHSKKRLLVRMAHATPRWIDSAISLCSALSPSLRRPVLHAGARQHSICYWSTGWATVDAGQSENSPGGARAGRSIIR